MFRGTAFLALGVLALAGCGREAAAPSGSGEARLTDARLGGLYERSCANCHEVPGTGAPQRGDRAAWALREASGLPARLPGLVASVRAGKGAMPPMGWCPECTDEDFAVLVSYLHGINAQ